jgi:hypothetical protein
MVFVAFVAGLAIAAAGCSKGDGNPRLVNPPDPKLKPVKPSAGGGGPPAKPADPGKDKPENPKDTTKPN